MEDSMAGQQQPPQPPTVPETVYVSFSADINAHTTESLIQVLANCINQRVRHVYILLSTPGGSVMHGMNVYNFLRAVPYKVTTHNVGNVDSIGNAIYLAADERFASEHSTFMFHGVGFDIQGAQRLEEKNVRECLDGILSNQKRIGSIIQQRTRISEQQTEAMFREAQTIDAVAAKDVGIVSEIKDARIPEGSTVLSFVFERKTS